MRPTRLLLPCLSAGTHVRPRVPHSPFLGPSRSLIFHAVTRIQLAHRNGGFLPISSSLVISVCISLHISHFVLIFPSTLFSLSVNDFSATSHIFSSLQPPFLSLLSLFFLLAIPPLSLSLTRVPFDETWIESGRVSVCCSSAPRRGCQGKRQAIFTLNII